jgi:hypothetical protein
MIPPIAKIQPPRAGRLWRLFILAALLTSLTSPPTLADGRAALAELKAAFIYRFTSFIDWPDSELAGTADAPFVITVIGDPALAEALRPLETTGRAVGGRPIRVREHDVAARIAPAQILFIGQEASAALPEILTRTQGWPTLLIGDTPGMAGRGVAIEFFLKTDILGEGQRLRFRLAPQALRERGLNASAQLYDVAEVIE